MWGSSHLSPWGGEESINGANLHLCFSKNSRFRVLVQKGTFCVKLGGLLLFEGISYTAGFTTSVIYISNYKSFDTHTYICLYFKINMQFRCSYPCADSQVDRPTANTKVIKNSISFSKRMWLAMWLLQEGQQNQPGLSYIHNLLYLCTFCVELTKYPYINVVTHKC